MYFITFRLLRIICVLLIPTALVGLKYYVLEDQEKKFYKDTFMEVKTKKEEILYPKRQLKESPIEQETKRRSELGSYPEQLVTPPEDSSSKGWLILESLSITILPEAVPELFNIQCWATSIKLNLIQPLVSEGQLITPFVENEGFNLLPLGTFYDLDIWSDLSRQRKVNDMVSLSDADIKEAQIVIVVDLGEEYPPDGTYNSLNCMNDSDKYQRRLKHNRGLTISKELCINSNQPITDIMNVISNLVKVEQDLHQVSKMILIVRKLNGRKLTNEAIAPEMLNCGVHRYHSIKPSEILQKDANKFITSRFPGSHFTAILLSTDPIKVKSFSGCLERSLTKLEGLKISNNTTNTFIALQELNEGRITKLTPFKMFFRSIYRNSYSLSQWRDDIAKYSSVYDSNYRILLQQSIATKAKCLILAGEGILSTYVREQYEQENKDQQSYCLIVIKECKDSS